ncbi:MAG: HAD-IC family P-type ATPase, partial [Campylobacterota bacterium]|nr:HAD-IC family P-type ATPase [Campylobacterota bacterium]
MFYTKSVEESLIDLDCTVDGLSPHEAWLRSEHYGKNILPEASPRTIFGIFFEQFKSPIIYVLLIATIVSFAIKEFTDAGFILAVLLINAIIGTYQEYTAGQRADALKKVLKTYVDVLRNSKRVKLLSEDVTVGDIVFFESGIRVPADIRLIDVKDLLVNESLLTGESVDVTKDATYLSSDIDEVIGDRKNMLYAGSIIIKGRAKGVVTAIADQTEVGKIASLLASSDITKTPLILRMEKFSLNISKIIGLIVLIIIVVGIYQEAPLKEIFFLTVAIAVSTIPEGLPVVITVALSVASGVMSKRNVIVRRLSAIEGLGSCTMIASDKTGTMTQNRLSVEYFVTQKSVYKSIEHVDRRVLQAAILCNEATFYIEGSEFSFIGDQVDVALARYALNMDPSLYEFKKRVIPIETMPYEPQNKFSGAIYKIDEKQLHFIKGSPEVILDKCSLSKDDFESISKGVDEWAS